MPRGPRESLKHGANVYSVCIKDYMCMCVLMGRKIIISLNSKLIWVTKILRVTVLRMKI